MMGVTPRVLTSPVSTCGRRRRVPPGSRSRWVAHPHAEIGGGTDICTACDDLTPIEREQPATVNTPRPARGRRLNDLSLELGGPSPFSGVLDQTGQLTPGTAGGGLRTCGHVPAARLAWAVLRRLWWSATSPGGVVWEACL